MSKIIYNEKYPHLFEPITIRGKVIKNRIVSSPHGDPKTLRTDSEGRAVFSDEAAEYYGNIARGGAGIVNTGHLGVDPRFLLGGHEEYFDFYSEHAHHYLLPSMHKMTELIHVYGALASLELNHGGYWCTPLEGYKLVGPSDTIVEGKEVVALTEDGMDEIADMFAKAALLGKRGGFDMVTVHAAHNWLLSEFFSPIENQRTDQYGGSVENRARFPKMVLDRIREYVGDDMLISVRISGSELVEGGITIEDCGKIVSILQETADIVQVSTGKIHNSFTEAFTFPMQYMEEGCNTYLAKQIKAMVDGPIETLGGIDDPAFADKLIAEGTADFVAMARGFIADPDWAEKARQDKADTIRPCIRCLRCMNFSAPPATGISRCTVNPHRVFTHEPKPVIGSSERRRVAVLGGGPAGMNAALELAAKGKEVTIYETKEHLGGRLEFADHVDFKEAVKKYRDYLIRQTMRDSNITVKLNTSARPELLQKENYDAIIVATGAHDFMPPIPGIDSPSVMHSSDLFGNEDKLGDAVAIIGGGQVGCEATIHLQAMGKTVYVIEQADDLMKDNTELLDEKIFTKFYMTHEFSMKHRTFVGVKEIDHVHIHLNTKCLEIDGSEIVIEHATEGVSRIKVDNIVMATGLRTDNQQTLPYIGLAPIVLGIGDCVKVGDISGASSSGYNASFRI